MSSRWQRFLTALLLLGGLAMGRAGQAATSPALPTHDFAVERGWLAMPDGVRLSVTWFKPVARQRGERFPVLLELLPYRKDDSFYLRDWPLYSYFARRGFLMAKVDLRGTGSSEGQLPDCEYSEVELADAVEIIRQLAGLPESNGKVGMWGISWGGFNALQVAMRRPPGLAAIVALHASDDLYHDDVHYIDGALHLDEYQLSIDHENGLPDSLEYRLGETYYRDRFDREPWIFTYLRQQQDGDFWRRGSLRFQPEAVEIPVFLIGGLLDGYRDSVPRLLESLRAPVRAILGPWNHSWPDDGVPGPNLEWRAEAVRFWERWLRGRESRPPADPRLLLFLRSGNPPDPGLERLPGRWIATDWPPRDASRAVLYPGRARDLSPVPPQAATEAQRYLPSSGVEGGFWWGELTGDQRGSDAASLTFDSPPLDAPLAIAGFPRVALLAAVDAPLAHWSARLEDVSADGEVTLVTGAVLNGAQRQSRLRPEPLPIGEAVQFEWPLHFTTWTFQPGHRIRLAVANTQFPMIWPTPSPMMTTVHLGERSFLELPVIPGPIDPEPPVLPPEPREERADARHLTGGGWPEHHQVTHDLLAGTTTVEWEGSAAWEIEQRGYELFERTVYTASDGDPAVATFHGEAMTRIAFPAGRRLELDTTIDLRSDAQLFHLTFTRRLLENGVAVREKTFAEAIPRNLQ